MGNLIINPIDSLSRSIMIAFPESKICAAVPGVFFIIKVREVNNVEFRNLKTISSFYNQEVDIKRGANFITIKFSEKAEEESND